jgi:hypothetical protein
MYFMPKKTVKDDLEGVSALMKTIPTDKPATKTTAKKKKAPKKKRKYTTKTKKGAKQ